MASMLVGLIAATACGLFAGGALYINLVEHPARMSCGAEAALREWAPSYRRATVMQASLAVVGGAAGVWAWALLGGASYLVGAFLLFLVVPYTLLVVLPTNRALLDLHARGEAAGAEDLLKRWNALHAVRTAAGLAAFVLMLVGLGLD